MLTILLSVSIKWVWHTHITMAEITQISSHTSLYRKTFVH